MNALVATKKNRTGNLTRLKPKKICIPLGRLQPVAFVEQRFAASQPFAALRQLLVAVGASFVVARVVEAVVAAAAVPENAVYVVVVVADVVVDAVVVVAAAAAFD